MTVKSKQVIFVATIFTAMIIEIFAIPNALSQTTDSDIVIWENIKNIHGTFESVTQTYLHTDDSDQSETHCKTCSTTDAIPNSEASPGDLLFTILDPEPREELDFFANYHHPTKDNNILAGDFWSDESAVNGGVVYLFNGSDGSILQTINNPTPEDGDNFGTFVEVTPTGDWLINAGGDDSGPNSSGSVYLFNGTTGNLINTIHNPGSNSFYGYIASIPSGDFWFLGTPSSIGPSGVVNLMNSTTGDIIYTLSHPRPGDSFNGYITSAPNGNLLISDYLDDTDGYNTGIAYLYNVTTGNLIHTLHNPTPEENDKFGFRSTAVLPNGNLFIGSGVNEAYLFDGITGELLLIISDPTPENDNHFGIHVMGTSTGHLVVSDGEDTAYVFDSITGELLLTIHSPTPQLIEFGFRMHSAPNGNLVIPSYDANPTGTLGQGTIHVFKGMNTLSPIITSLIADDPDDLDNVYSVGDTITITFDSDTNMPGGTGGQGKGSVNALFTFTEFIGQSYNGQWIAADTFIITITDANNSGPPVIGVTTVTPTINGTSILSADETSITSSDVSPVLSGDFGTVIQWIQFPLTDGIPLTTDCDDMVEYGRVMLDAQGSTENTLYLCTASGWIAK